MYRKDDVDMIAAALFIMNRVGVQGFSIDISARRKPVGAYAIANLLVYILFAYAEARCSTCYHAHTLRNASAMTLFKMKRSFDGVSERVPKIEGLAKACFVFLSLIHI